MASSAYYKKVNAQKALSHELVQPLLEQLTAELFLSRPSDPLERMIMRLKEMENDIRTAHAAAEPRRLPGVEPAEAACETISGQCENVVAPRKLISIFGPPYSGKTTQCSMALGDRGVMLSPFELLNEAVNSGRQKNGSQGVRIPPDLQIQVLDLMRQNIPASTEVLTRLLTNHILQVEAEEERYSAEHGCANPRTIFFLDGYPRTVEQALALEKALGELYCAIILFCPKNVCFDRMDAAQVLDEDKSRRWRLYNEYTVPLTEYWKGKKTLRVVDGSQDRNETNMAVKVHIIDN